METIRSSYWWPAMNSCVVGKLNVSIFFVSTDSNNGFTSCFILWVRSTSAGHFEQVTNWTYNIRSSQLKKWHLWHCRNNSMTTIWSFTRQKAHSTRTSVVNNLVNMLSRSTNVTLMYLSVGPSCEFKFQSIPNSWPLAWSTAVYCQSHLYRNSSDYLFTHICTKKT